MAVQAATLLVLAPGALRALHLDTTHGTGLNWHLPRNPGKRPSAQAVVAAKRLGRVKDQPRPRQGSNEARQLAGRLLGNGNQAWHERIPT